MSIQRGACDVKESRPQLPIGELLTVALSSGFKRSVHTEPKIEARFFMNLISAVIIDNMPVILRACVWHVCSS